MNTGPMICGGDVSIYYTAQSTYNNSLMSDSGLSSLFFTVIFNVDMFRQGHQTV